MGRVVAGTANTTLTSASDICLICSLFCHCVDVTGIHHHSPTLILNTSTNLYPSLSLQMDIRASRSSDSSEGKPHTGSHSHGTAGTLDPEYEWILSSVFFSTISEVVIRNSALNSTSSSQSKARLVEGVFFALFILSIVISAAVPEILKF